LLRQNRGITVPGTLRDSLILLALVLDQQTELQPTQIMTDTGAYADVVFGLLTPRLSVLSAPGRYRRCPALADRPRCGLRRVQPHLAPPAAALTDQRRPTQAEPRGLSRHRGELRQRYREGQEDQLGALGLVVNMIVLWNTIYMQAALDQLRAKDSPSWPKTSHI
jgi:TnpA family transposase